MIVAQFGKKKNIVTQYWDADWYRKHDIVAVLQEYQKSHPNSRKVENLISTIKKDPEFAFGKSTAKVDTTALNQQADSASALRNTSNELFREGRKRH